MTINQNLSTEHNKQPLLRHTFGGDRRSDAEMNALSSSSRSMAAQSSEVSNNSDDDDSIDFMGSNNLPP
jgi:hypothetical protein